MRNEEVAYVWAGHRRADASDFHLGRRCVDTADSSLPRVATTDKLEIRPIQEGASRRLKPWPITPEMPLVSTPPAHAYASLSVAKPC
jgi:hypothetical protein